MKVIPYSRQISSKQNTPSTIDTFPAIEHNEFVRQVLLGLPRTPAHSVYFATLEAAKQIKATEVHMLGQRCGTPVRKFCDKFVALEGSNLFVWSWQVL
jgi:hypothetical protein